MDLFLRMNNISNEDMCHCIVGIRHLLQVPVTVIVQFQAPSLALAFDLSTGGKDS